MIKKIVLITLFVLFTGVLIAGGVYRTSAKSGYDISLGGENIVEISQSPNNAIPRNGQAGNEQEHLQDGERAGQGQGNGGQSQGRNQKTEAVPDEDATYGQGRGGQGKEADDQGGLGQGQQGGGYGRNGGSQGQGQGQNQQEQYAEVHDMILIEGTISQAPAAGVDMIVETAAGQVLVGTGPGYLQEMGFNLANGESVQVNGYYENDEFKAQTITRLSDGQSIPLRDEFGRPMWSGAGRNASGGGGNGI
jgi:hypothetical protein